MKPIIRLVLAALAILLLAAYLSPPAWSMEPIPRTVADLQSNTACGARAVGMNPSTGSVIEYQSEGQRVGPDGRWTNCEMPKAAPAPSLKAGCTTPELITWQSAGNQCEHRGAVQIAHGARAVIQPGPGSTDGVLLLSCRNGVITRQLEACSPAVECAGSYRGTDDGGATWWAWSGRLREGSTAQASDGAGNSRPIRCDGGKLRLQ